MDRNAAHRELDDARAAFHRLLATATDADLRRLSTGTRWTNKQLLFHMLLGYLILRALTMLVRLFGRLPDGVSRLRLSAEQSDPAVRRDQLPRVRLGGNTNQS